MWNVYSPVDQPTFSHVFTPTFAPTGPRDFLRSPVGPFDALLTPILWTSFIPFAAEDFLLWCGVCNIARFPHHRRYQILAESACEGGRSLLVTRGVCVKVSGFRMQSIQKIFKIQDTFFWNTFSMLKSRNFSLKCEIKKKSFTFRLSFIIALTLMLEI